MAVVEDPHDDHNALIDKLKVLVDELEYPTDQSYLRRVGSVLDELAQALREASRRESLGDRLCPLIGRLVRAVPSDSLSNASSSSDLRPWAEVLGQVGRVAANLSAECDRNRDRLVDENYPTLILSLVPGTQAPSLLPFRSIVASLLNLVVEHHGGACRALSRSENLTALCRFANQAYHALFDSDETQANLASTVAPWLWSILSVLSEEEPQIIAERLTSSDLVTLILPLRPFQSPTKAGRSVDEIDLQLLTDCCTIIERLTTIDKPVIRPFLATTSPSGQSVLAKLFSFLEHGHLPDVSSIRESNHAEGEEDQDEEQSVTIEQAEKVLGTAKASTGRTIVSLSSEMSMTIGHEAHWVTIRSWLYRERREDLVACALLSYGNGARDDSTATALLQEEPSILPLILAHLTPKTPIIVQHAAIGLLKNLSVPLANRRILGEAGIVERIAGMGIWAEERDVIKPLQAGSVGLIKNLCRDCPENVLRLTNIPHAVDQVLDLISRTDDPAIKMESTRIFVNCIRTLAGGDQSSALGLFATQRVVASLTEMLRTADQYPVLVNEALVALALLVTFGGESAGENVCEGLSLEHPLSAEGQKPRAIDTLCAVLLGAEHTKSTKEIRANIVTLLKQLPPGGDGKIVVEEVKESLQKANSGGLAIPDEASAWLGDSVA